MMAREQYPLLFLSDHVPPPEVEGHVTTVDEFLIPIDFEVHATSTCHMSYVGPLRDPSNLKVWCFG